MKIFLMINFLLKIIQKAFLIKAELFGEEIDIKKHGFKVEIKSPTFHEMEIDEGEEIRLKYLLFTNKLGILVHLFT